MNGEASAAELITVGHLGSPHGLRGDLHLVPDTDFPERLVPGRRVALCPPEGAPHWTRIARIRALGGRGLVVSLEGLRGREAAAAFSGGRLCVDPADLPPLPAGSYYHHQLVGLRVLRADGRVLGQLVEVRRTGANDVYVVQRPDGAQALVPAITDAVAEIDPAAGRVLLRHLPGLLDDD